MPTVEAPAAGPASTPPRRQLIGERYHVHDVVGRGGMGAVYRVRDAITGRELALKRLSAAHERKNKRARRIFEREYRTLRQLSHPRIIRVFDYGIDEQGAFYTMELLDGSDMRELSPMPHGDACRYLREVAASLALLHARGLVHRDITPRNVRRTGDGHCKLIDFGALSSRGDSGTVVGTPPFVPPEALEGAPLDDRVDLYALGCLGYWMLTGTHAYPATDTRQLASFWSREVPAPSAVQPETGPDGAALPPIPREVDELIMSLIRLDPMARPPSAGVVIDRLDVIVGAPEHDPLDHAESYLAGARLVERNHELADLGRALSRLERRRGSAVHIEGPQGVGRSRLLSEMALAAQLRGVKVVSVDAELSEAPFGLARAVAAELLAILPARTREAASGPHAAVLEVVPELSEAAPTPAPPTDDEDALHSRTRVQAALRDWLFAICEGQPLVLCVDNVQRADEPSLLWLASVAHVCRHHPLLLITTVRSGEDAEAPAALSALEGAAGKRSSLGGLSVRGLGLWLGSLFGEVDTLPRLARYLHEQTLGNPSHCMEVLDYLIDAGEIVYRDGTWILPSAPASLVLPTRFDALRRRLDRLPVPARRLVGAFAMVRGPVTQELARQLAAEIDVGEYAPHVDTLLSHGILVAGSEGYRLLHESLRDPAMEVLEDEARDAMHRRIATAMLAQPSPPPSVRLRAAVHLLRANDPAGVDLVANDALAVCLHPEEVGACVPPLLAALGLLRERSPGSFPVACVLAALGLSSYASDRRLGIHQNDVLSAFRRVSGLDVGRRLRPYVGLLLSTYAGLAVGLLRYLRLPRAQRAHGFRTVLQGFVTSLLGLGGRAAVCLDRAAIVPIVRALRPLVVLGRGSSVAFAHDYCRGLAMLTCDRHAATYAYFLELERRLRRPGAMPDVRGASRQLWQGGVSYVLGIFESFRGDRRALERAEELEQSGIDVHQLVGAQIRVQYHGFRGEVEAVRTAFDRMEVCAIQSGSTWQVETWAAVAVNLYGGLWGDLIITKRALEDTERMAAEEPALRRYAQSSRATYLLLRGMADECIDLYEEMFTHEAPFERIGWSVSTGLLAQAYGARGQHGRALSLCERVLEGADPEDAPYYAMRLPVEVARVDALRGLGRHEEAEEAVREALRRHGDHGGPLTLGALHEAAARAALARGDRKGYTYHLKDVERLFTPLANPSLIARYRDLVDEGGSEGGIALKIATMRKVNAFDSLLSSVDTRATAGHHVLQWLTDQLEDFQAFLFVAGEPPELLGSTDDEVPDEEVAELVQESLATLGGDADTTMCGTESRTAQGRQRRKQHHVYLLSYSDAAGLHGVGALVLVGEARKAPRIRYELLQVAAQHLRRLRAEGAAFDAGASAVDA